MSSPVQDERDINRDHLITIDRSEGIDQRPIEEREQEKKKVTLSAESSGKFLSLVASNPLPSAAPPRDEPQPLPPNAHALVERIQKDIDRQHGKARTQLAALERKIEAQEKKCVAPKIDEEIQKIRFLRQQVLVAHGPALAAAVSEEKSRLDDLLTFKKANKLLRDAHYPSSRILSIGIVVFLVLVEAGVNGVLFADTSDQGLFGGWLEALVLSLTNVGVAFLSGHLVLTQLHRRHPLAKALAAVAILFCAGAILAVNLTGAHYRDFRAAAAQAPLEQPLPKPEAAPQALKGTVGKEKDPKASPRAGDQKFPPKPPQVSSADERPAVSLPPVAAAAILERSSIQRAIEAPLAFNSFTSFFLFIIGLCCAVIAAIDGYKLDDPFPGYGRRHRAYAEARERSGAHLKRVLREANDITSGAVQGAAKKLEAFAHEVEVLRSLHQSFDGERNALAAALERAAVDGEHEVMHSLRLTRKLVAAEDVAALAVKALPELPEHQPKLLASHERKLASLRRSLSKEQDELLQMFETATGAFQKLLSEAAQTGLHMTAVPERA